MDIIIKILMDWYGKIYSVVRWYDTLSRQESVRSGIRQKWNSSRILTSTELMGHCFVLVSGYVC